MNLNVQKRAFFCNSQLKSRTVFLILTGITFLIRFPFFFRDYVDRDESTFILLGQSWVDGYLPYTQLWDLKPPLTFAFFASIIYAFGKSFIAIRFFGALLVAITAFYTYKIGTKITTKLISLWASLFCVVLLSLFGSLQGVMSEHICMGFFIPALYLIVSKKGTVWLFASGILMGMVVMVKLNMAYPILLIGLFLCSEIFSTKNSTNPREVVSFGTGIIVVVLLTILPYYINNQFQIWWDSVILAPLEYTEARRFSIFKLAPTFILIGGFLFYCWKKGIISLKKRTSILLLVAICGVLISFFKGGRVNGHYLIQVHPMLVIFVAIMIHQLYHQSKITIPKSFLFILLLIPVESYMEYVNVFKNKITRGTFFNGEGFSVPSYIKENHLDTENILFFGYHIGYWNLNELPPSLASTHPSNICRDELYTFFNNPRRNSLEELQFLMEELRPKTVVVRKGRLVFDKLEIEENEYINAYLTRYYKVEATVENAEILKRLEGL